MAISNPFRLAWSVVFCGAALCVALSAYGQAAAEGVFQKLEAILPSGNWIEVQRQLEALQVPEESKIRWLEQKSEEGNVPMMLLLSKRFHKEDFERSLKWYARGLLSRALDSASCSDPSSAANLLEFIEPVRSDGIEEPQLLNAAIQSALAQPNVLQPTRWSGWLCLPERRLTGEKEMTARAAAFRDMTIEGRSFSLFTEAVERGREQRFKIVDTGLTIRNAVPRDKATWVDDRYALLIGSEEGTRKDGYDVNVYLWDAETYQRKRITPAGYDAHAVCSHRGYATVGLTRRSASTGEFVRSELAGDFPELRVIPAEPWKGSSYPGSARPGCHVSTPMPSVPNHAEVRWLREEHGHIESVRRERSWYTDTTLVKPDGQRVPLRNIVLPFASSVLGYADWKNAYLLQGAWEGDQDTLTSRRRMRGEGAVLLWMHPDGATVPVTIPYGYWDTSEPPSPLYKAVRPGILGVGTRFERSDRDGFAGLFLFESTRVTRVIGGMTSVLAISPDGCRAAVSNQPTTALSIPVSLKIIDFCRSQR